ncbi:MAG TPA: pilin [Xanthomonadales bacterium]|nr:pilin [Xanthomonadales bacterium]
MKKLVWIVLIAAATALAACGRDEPAVAPPSANVDLALAHAEVSAPAWLRERLPADAVAYFRIPSLWGALAAADGRPLDALFASEPNAQAIAKLRTAFANDPVIAQTGVGPWITLLATHQRSPLEIAVVDASKVATPASQVLVSVKLGFADAAAANAALAALAPGVVSVEKPLADGSIGVLDLGGTKLYAHFDPAPQRLTLLAGLTAHAGELEKRVAALAQTGEHPMHALERDIDAGGQGFFVWTNVEALRPLAATAQQGTPADAFERRLVAQTRGAAFGAGSVGGRGVASFRIDAPQAPLLHYLPRTAKKVEFETAGMPEWAFTWAVWTPAEWAQFRAAYATDAGAEAGAALDKAAAEMQAKAGFGLEDLFAAFGPDVAVVSDAAGMYAAVRLNDADAFARLLDALKSRFGVTDQTREIGGTTFHHIAVPGLSAEDTQGASAPEAAAWLKLYARMGSHVYWIERDGYLILADVPQTLMDYVAAKPEFDVGAWLAQSGLDVEHAVFAGVTRTRHAQRTVHAAYLSMLQSIGDLSGQPVDMYALPTAAQLGLPEDGTFAVQFSAWNDGAALEAHYAQSPLEALTGGSTIGTVAVLGVLAAIAVPAYQDYTIRAKVAGALNEAVRVKLAVSEYLLANGKLPPDGAALDIELPVSTDVGTIDYEDGAILVRFDERQPELAGTKLALVPYRLGEDIGWTCGSSAMDAAGEALSDADGAALTDVPERYVPASCRR